MSAQAAPPGVPSFLPVPHFLNFEDPSIGVQPPRVSPAPGPSPHLMAYHQVPQSQVVNPALRPYVPGMPNGYAPPTGLPRYPYPPMYTSGVLGVPQPARPITPVLSGSRPLFPPFVRPLPPSITPVEKPQTTVYVGKIAPTVENDCMLSLLRFCGPVKSWKRAQDPTDGTPRGFGFCEFESADGVLRALRLLSKFNIDGQELVLTVNQATREYLERYVQKKTENSNNIKESQATRTNLEDGNAPSTEKDGPSKSSGDGSDIKSYPDKDTDKGIKENTDVASFGLVTEVDKEGDREAREKLSVMLEERFKTRPLPPTPPHAPADGFGNSNSELLAKSRDGDSDVDATRTGKNDETASDNKAGSEQDKPETSSPDKNHRYDRRSRDRDRDQDLKRDKDQELERETERGRVRKEREQRRKIEDSEREYEDRLKEWEYREREKERQRQYEKERERKRKKEILDEEEGEDYSWKNCRRSALEDKRRKRLREKAEDMTDRLKEQEEIAYAQRRAEEERLHQQHRDGLQTSPEKAVFAEEDRIIEGNDMVVVEHNYEGNSGNENHSGDGRILQDCTTGDGILEVFECLNDDVAELEWLSQFVDDSFTDFPVNSSLVGTINVLPPDPSARARSKRSHRLPITSMWTSSRESEDSPASGRSRSKKDVSRSTEGGVRRCTHCASEKTPQWRIGPMGPRTLCNACGVRYRSGRLVPE